MFVRRRHSGTESTHSPVPTWNVTTKRWDSTRTLPQLLPPVRVNNIERVKLLLLLATSYPFPPSFFVFQSLVSPCSLPVLLISAPEDPSYSVLVNTRSVRYRNYRARDDKDASARNACDYESRAKRSPPHSFPSLNSPLDFDTQLSMQGPNHPLQGVGYSDRPTPFDQLSRVAMAHGQQQPLPIASTSYSSSYPPPAKRGPASSNGDFGPSPPEYGHGRSNKKARKSSSGPGGNLVNDGGDSLEMQQAKKRSKQILSCSECKVSTT